MKPKTGSTENPYVKARRQWNDIFANHAMEKRIFQVLLSLSLILNIGQLYYNYLLHQKSTMRYYVVEKNHSDGSAMAYLPKANASGIDDLAMSAHLFRWMEKARSVYRDPLVIKKNLTEAYKVVSTDIAENFLDPHYKENNPFDLAERLTREVTSRSFLKESDQTFLLEWDELDRDTNYKPLGPAVRWKALISVKIIPHKSHDEVHANRNNPFAIYIVGISWNRIQ